MRRIQRSSAKESYIQSLLQDDQCPFDEIWRLVHFCAALGQCIGERSKLGQVDSGKSIPANYFSNSPAWPGFLYLLGLVETNSTDVLKDEEDAQSDLVRIFEEYADSGLAYLMSKYPAGNVNVARLMDILNELTMHRTSQVGLQQIQL